MDADKLYKNIFYIIIFIIYIYQQWKEYFAFVFQVIHCFHQWYTLPQSRIQKIFAHRISIRTLTFNYPGYGLNFKNQPHYHFCLIYISYIVDDQAIAEKSFHFITRVESIIGSFLHLRLATLQ